MPADIGTRLALLEKRLQALARAPKLANASIENGALEVYDAQGSLRALVGQQPDGTSGVTIVNGPVPPTPAAPQVEAALGALYVSWNGRFVDAAAAPLDFARVEVHLGPTAEFEPTQGTLRDTIETPQGGSCTVSLPYTEWWVRLRGRSLSGTAGPASAAVAGTPRRAAAADLQAGAVTADTLAADAISGKHITGGTIDGAIVTGATVRTAATGNRVVVTPAPPTPLEAIPSVLLYSDSDLEKVPGTLKASVNADGTALPYAALTAPAVQIDRWNLPDASSLSLLSPQLGVRGGSFDLTATSGGNGDQGQSQLYGYSANGPTGTSSCRLYVEDGKEAPGGSWNLGARSFVTMEGAEVTVRTASTAGDTQTVFTPAGITVSGWIAHAGTDWTRIIGLGPGVTSDATSPAMVRVTANRTIELCGYVTLKDSQIQPGRQLGVLPQGYRPAARRHVLVPSTANGTILRIDIGVDGSLQLYPMLGNRSTWVGFDGVSCRAD
ncbi:hypothetical protein [Streptomyces yunnanensis]|uniref:Uncharacterized protein n=1 Tax=Streptomyces yunnanensis TaxID=156453 RepID=A0A9X8N5P1_9ACTN|nr:hypothetical protein [Streptomyces yunnanensis]SHN08371.1 hypothetical protein SAMN05216268_11978 [Streptomyces yunnanensis]